MSINMNDLLGKWVSTEHGYEVQFTFEIPDYNPDRFQFRTTAFSEFTSVSGDYSLDGETLHLKASGGFANKYNRGNWEDFEVISRDPLLSGLQCNFKGAAKYSITITDKVMHLTYLGGELVSQTKYTLHKQKEKKKKTAAVTLLLVFAVVAIIIRLLGGN